MCVRACGRGLPEMIQSLNFNKKVAYLVQQSVLRTSHTYLSTLYTLQKCLNSIISVSRYIAFYYPPPHLDQGLKCHLFLQRFQIWKEKARCYRETINSWVMNLNERCDVAICTLLGFKSCSIGDRCGWVQEKSCVIEKQKRKPRCENITDNEKQLKKTPLFIHLLQQMK